MDKFKQKFSSSENGNFFNNALKKEEFKYWNHMFCYLNLTQEVILMVYLEYF